MTSIAARKHTGDSGSTPSPPRSEDGRFPKERDAAALPPPQTWGSCLVFLVRTSSSRRRRAASVQQAGTLGETTRGQALLRLCQPPDREGALGLGRSPSPPAPASRGAGGYQLSKKKLKEAPGPHSRAPLLQVTCTAFHWPPPSRHGPQPAAAEGKSPQQMTTKTPHHKTPQRQPSDCNFSFPFRSNTTRLSSRSELPTPIFKGCSDHGPGVSTASREQRPHSALLQ